MRETLAELMEKYPFLEDFFQENHLPIEGRTHLRPDAFLESLSEEERENLPADPQALEEEIGLYIRQMEAFLGLSSTRRVESLTILPGHDKSGNPEGFGRLELLPSQIVSIVGPTGSGKSRLLADIEWAARGDTPTGRSILINQSLPDEKWRFSPQNKLVAQLSQNMNFVMDVRVHEFLEMHAQSRGIQDAVAVSRRILEEANLLAGEPFEAHTPVTGLSGGQSRALMIADTAILSASPIVLIDEIENAGIDRKKALKLLVSQDKIVLMATHDPLLALMAHRRIVIRNGGIQGILETSRKEKDVLKELEKMDAVMQTARTALRLGERL